MYEIYINDRPLRLSASAPLVSPAPDAYASGKPSLATHLVARYTGKVKTLLHYADLLEKGSPKVTAVTLYHTDVEQLWADFKTHYKIVEAAGGIVNLGGTDKYLFIFRRGYLDLPKGKIDEGETKTTAALREVHEETGLALENLFIQNAPATPLPATPLPIYPTTHLPHFQTTLHTYRNRKEKRILKPTYWFEMQTSQKELTPETEEDIEWARWLTWEEAMNLAIPFYASLSELKR